MRGALDVDPNAIDYGRATPALRTLLRRWSAIEWFEPLAADAAPLPALRDHMRLAHAYAPDLVPAHSELRLELGDLADFVRLCARVRANLGSWDWETVLKQLAHRHRRAHAWSLSKAVALRPGGDWGPGDLVLQIGAAQIWNDLAPKLAYDRLGPAEAAARWFMSYATMNLIASVEWQLAEPDAALHDNPFEALLRCHAEGALIFSLGPAELLAFGLRG